MIAIVKALVSIPYQLAHMIRSMWNDLLIVLRLRKRNKLAAFTISIGNISFGGTGKTPITMALAQHLSDRGLKVCILTRGYKSQNKHTIIVDTQKGESYQYSALGKQSINPRVVDIGDEAMEMSETLADTNTLIVVDADRYRGGELAYRDYQPDVFILDDGLQYISLHRDLEIIVKNVQEKGYYRESPLAYLKADYIIHSKVDDRWLRANKNKIAAKFNLSLTSNLHTDRGIGVFTGIGDPETFLTNLQDYLKGQGLWDENSKIDCHFFPDHHFYSIGEVTEVLSLGINIISTPKDLVKIPEGYRDRFVTVKHQVEFTPVGFLSEVEDRVFTASSSKVAEQKGVAV